MVGAEGLREYREVCHARIASGEQELAGYRSLRSLLDHILDDPILWGNQQLVDNMAYVARRLFPELAPEGEPPEPQPEEPGDLPAGYSWARRPEDIDDPKLRAVALLTTPTHAEVRVSKLPRGAEGFSADETELTKELRAYGGGKRGQRGFLVLSEPCREYLMERTDELPRPKPRPKPVGGKGEAKPGRKKGMPTLSEEEVLPVLLGLDDADGFSLRDAVAAVPELRNYYPLSQLHALERWITVADGEGKTKLYHVSPDVRERYAGQPRGAPEGAAGGAAGGDGGVPEMPLPAEAMTELLLCVLDVLAGLGEGTRATPDEIYGRLHPDAGKGIDVPTLERVMDYAVRDPGFTADVLGESCIARDSSAAGTRYFLGSVGNPKVLQDQTALELAAQEIAETLGNGPVGKPNLVDRLVASLDMPKGDAELVIDHLAQHPDEAGKLGCRIADREGIGIYTLDM